MQLSTSELLDRCVASGLIDTARAARWLAQLANGGIVDGTIAAERLVSSHKLTPEQAEVLLCDPRPRLTVEGWQLWTRASEFGLPAQWWRAVNQQGDEALVAIWAQPQPLVWRGPAAASAVDKLLLIPRIIKLEPGQFAAIIAPPPAGTTLAQRVRKEPLNDEELTAFAARAARALSAIETWPMPLMAVLPGHWWFDESLPTARLLCDLSMTPEAMPWPPSGSGVPADVAGYAAPETLLEHAPPDPTSLVYSLGCNLSFARFGVPPFEAETTEQIAELHATARPAGFDDLGTVSPALLSVAHAMAKTREARFRNAAEFSESLPWGDAPPTQPDSAGAGAGATMYESADDEFEIGPLPNNVRAAAPPQNARAAIPSQNAPAAAAPQPIDSIPDQPAPAMQGSTAPPIPPAAKQASPQRALGRSSKMPISTAMPSIPIAFDPRNPIPAMAAGPERPPARRRRKNPMAWVIGGLSLAVLSLVVIGLTYGTGGSRRSPSPTSTDVRNRPVSGTTQSAVGEEVPANRPRDQASDQTAAAFELTDDAKILWAPPQSGQPIGLRGVPNGPQAIIAFRPPALRDGAGKQLSAVLVPELDRGLLALERAAGIPLSDMRQVVIALFDGPEGWPTPVIVVHLTEPQPIGELQAAWGPGLEPFQPAIGDPILSRDPAQGPSFYVGPRLAPADAPIQWFALGPRDSLLSVAEATGAEPLLPRQLSELWAQTDERSALSLVAMPNFLFAGGRAMLQQYAPHAVESVRQFLIPDVHGLSVRTDLSPQWYLEVRVTPGTEAPLTELVDKLRNTIIGLPAAAEARIVNGPIDNAWRSLSVRLPAMLRALTEQSRFGVSRQQAVFNAFLPSQAAPNLALAGWLTVGASSSASNPASTRPATEPKQATVTLTELLDRPISVSFDQEGLQVAATLIANEANAAAPAGSAVVEVFLLGNDMERDGITKNQQVRDFRFKETPLREVLTALVMRANPVTTVKSPAEVDQKLVWVVGSHPEQADRQAVLVTTRTASAGTYELPAEFVGPPATP